MLFEHQDDEDDSLYEAYFQNPTFDLQIFYYFWSAGIFIFTWLGQINQDLKDYWDLFVIPMS